MALRFLDSFDHYTTVLQKWNVAPGPPVIDAAAARTGVAGLRMTAGNQSANRTLDAQGTWIIGFGHRQTLINIRSLAYTLDGASLQGGLELNADGTMSLYRGGVVVATSARSILVDVWYYIEFKHIIDNVAGTLEVRVNGEVWATFAGDTQATVNPTANVIRIGPAGGAGISGQIHFDDLYILDGTGAVPYNDYLGDTQVERLLPNGNGSYQEWVTLVGAATHWQAVSETPPDEDVSYVEENLLNDRDTYTFGDLSVASATLRGVQVCIRARKTAAGAANIARMYRNAAVDSQGADVALSESYAYLLEQLQTDPITAVDWTVARVNSAEFGVRVR